MGSCVSVDGRKCQEAKKVRNIEKQQTKKSSQLSDKTRDSNNSLEDQINSQEQKQISTNDQNKNNLFDIKLEDDDYRIVNHLRIVEIVNDYHTYGDVDMIEQQQSCRNIKINNQKNSQQFVRRYKSY